MSKFVFNIDDYKKTAASSFQEKKYQRLIGVICSPNFDFNTSNIPVPLKQYISSKKVLELYSNAFKDFQDRYEEYIKRDVSYKIFNYRDAQIYFKDGLPVNVWLYLIFKEYLENKSPKPYDEFIVKMYMDLTEPLLVERPLFYCLKVLYFVSKGRIEVVKEVIGDTFWQFIFEYFYPKKSFLLEIKELDDENLSELEQSLLKKLKVEIDKVLLETKPAKKGKVVLSKGSYSLMLARFKEIERFIIDTSATDITLKDEFTDGKLMADWFNRYISFFNNYILTEDEKDALFEQLYKIVTLLYADEKFRKNDKSEINYGPVLQRVIVMFGKRIIPFEEIKIPYRAVNDLLNNSIIPSLEDVDKVLFYLSNLQKKVVSEYQQKVLVDAKEKWKLLKEEISLKHTSDDYHYSIWGITDLALYEKEINLDRSVLDEARSVNEEWYFKALIYNHILINKGNISASNDYYYDGTNISRWLVIQHTRFTEGDYSVLNDCQKVMISAIDGVKTFKEDVEMYFLNNVDFVLAKIQEAKEKGIPLSKVKVNEYSVSELYNSLIEFIKNPEKPLDDSMVSKLLDYCQRLIKQSVNFNEHYTDFSFYLQYLLIILGYDNCHYYFEDLIGLKRKSTTKMLRGEFPCEDDIELLISFISNISPNNVRPLVYQELLKIKDAAIENREIIKNNSKRSINEIVTSNLPVAEDLLLMVDKNIIQILKKNNPTWLNEAIQYFNYIKSFYENNDKDILNIEAFVWFYQNKLAYFSGRLSQEQIIVLNAIVNYAIEKAKVVRKNRFFANLEAYEKITDSGIFPNPEVKINGIFAANFYHKLSIKYFNGYMTPQRYDLDSIIRVKNLIGKVGELKRHSCFTDDRIDGNDFYLGDTLEKLRICLMILTNDFEKMFFKEGVYNCVRANMISIPKASLDKLLCYLNSLDRNSLREDQNDDIERFLKIIKTKKMDSMALIYSVN